MRGPRPAHLCITVVRRDVSRVRMRATRGTGKGRARAARWTPRRRGGASTSVVGEPTWRVRTCVWLSSGSEVWARGYVIRGAIFSEKNTIFPCSPPAPGGDTCRALAITRPPSLNRFAPLLVLRVQYFLVLSCSVLPRRRAGRSLPLLVQYFLVLRDPSVPRARARPARTHTLSYTSECWQTTGATQPVPPAPPGNGDVVPRPKA